MKNVRTLTARLLTVAISQAISRLTSSQMKNVRTLKARLLTVAISQAISYNRKVKAKQNNGAMLLF